MATNVITRPCEADRLAHLIGVLTSVSVHPSRFTDEELRATHGLLGLILTHHNARHAQAGLFGFHQQVIEEYERREVSSFTDHEANELAAELAAEIAMENGPTFEPFADDVEPGDWAPIDGSDSYHDRTDQAVYS